MLFLLFFSTESLHSQFYSMGTDPAGVKWKYIQTPNYKIIFPSEIDSLAQRYAKLMEGANSWVQNPLKIKSKPIEVVLHPYNVKSNGLVVWAPKRVEFITSPLSFGGYSQNWEKQLVVHEIRHIAQISKFEHGIFKPLSWLIGQQAQGIGVGLYIDKWALEGDAVVSETELSETGRGRDPQHLIYFKAAFLDGDYRTWRKWKLGSGKRYSPDIYSLGYLVNTYIRISSDNFYYMGDLTEYLVRHFYNPSAAKRAYESSTGKRISGHFKSIIDILGNKWAREDSLKPPFTPNISISKEGKDYSSYKSIVAVAPDSLFAVKWDMDNPTSLVFLDSAGNEKRISYLGTMSSFLSKGNEKLYWTEQIPSTRWEQKSYSVLRCYDIMTGEIKSLSRKSNYSNPSVSNTGDTISVSQYSIKGSSSLVLLESNKYCPIASFPAPHNGQIKESVFIGKLLYATVITDKGMGLFSIDPKTGVWALEIEEQNRSISRLNGINDALCFESDLNGTNNIYSYSPKIKFLQRLTNSRFGAFAPFVDNQNSRIYYSDYDKNGYRVVYANEDSLLWEPSLFSKPYKEPFANILSQQAGFSIDTLDVSSVKDFNVKPYNAAANLFRFHSWAPFYYNVDKIKNISYDNFYEILSPGITLYSQNTLSTTTAMLAYSYGNGFNAAHMRLTYSGTYPVIEIKSDYNERNRNDIRLMHDNQGRKFQLVSTVPNSPYFTTSLFAYVPLNLSSGGWSRGLIPKFLWRFGNDSYYSVRNGKYRYYQYLSYGIQYYSMLNTSSRGLFPKWGIGANFQMNFVPFSGENFGSITYSNVYGYIPGLMKNHGVRFSFSYQLQDYKGKNYLFSNLANSPRGYDQLYGKQFVSLSADYAFPIYLGDIELSSILYLKRLQVIPFADWAYNQGELEDTHMFSAGSDLMLDFNVLNISLPLSAGVRYARTKEGSNLFQFLFTLPI